MCVCQIGSPTSLCGSCGPVKISAGISTNLQFQRSEVVLTWDAAQQVVLAGLVVLRVPLVLDATHAAGLHRGQPGRSRGSRGGHRIQVLESIRESCRMDETPTIHYPTPSLEVRGHGEDSVCVERCRDHMWWSKGPVGGQTELIQFRMSWEGAEGGGVTDPGV